MDERLSRHIRSAPIAVVGVGALFAGSTTKEGFWRDILAGRDLITDVPPSHWLIDDYFDPDPAAVDKTYCKRGSFLPTVDFDPLEYGIPPTNIPATDTSQLLALVVARQVLDDAAQGQFSSLDRDRISVILGVTSTTELVMDLGGRLQRPVWVKALRESGMPEDEVQRVCDRIADSYVPWKESSFPGLLGNVVAGRVANHFDLGGTNCVTDAACASSLSAVHMAVLELQCGSSDLVITGGVDTLNHILMYTCFSKTPAFSPTGDCRPFSADADGTIIGEGLCMLALKRLEDAESDGDRIYSVIRGVGSSSDGKAPSIYAPRAEGQVKALRRAYLQAGYSPATVEMVEAHGTATKAGDVAEVTALRATFEESGRSDSQWCALGSIKSQIGHTKTTAGAAGLFKAVMALHSKILPPTIKVDKPNPSLDLAHSPFYVNTKTRPWIRDGMHPRRASVSSFGFGGTDFHVTLEEYCGPGKQAWKIRASPSELVLLSADSSTALSARCRQLSAEADIEGSLSEVARRSQQQFDVTSRARLAVVASDEADLQAKLARAAAMIDRQPAQAFALPTGVYFDLETPVGDIAFLFPGQGSQYVGMGADLAMSFDVARQVWDETASIELVGRYRLHQLVFPPPVFSEEDREAQVRGLTATDCAQPAIGVMSLSHLDLLTAIGLHPSCVGGHSFGEVTALHAAGALDRQEFLRIAQRRGTLMAEAASMPGAMTAVFHAAEDIVALVKALELDVVVANYNSPGQVVFAGPVPAVETLEERLGQEGYAFRHLPVATAFHSHVVSGSVAPFEAFLRTVSFGEPAIPVYSNTQAKPYPSDPDEARSVLAQQIARPVRFSDQIAAMHAAGVRTFLEVGPGSTLTSLVEQTLAGEEHIAISVERKGLDGVTALWHALGHLSVAGVLINFEPLWVGYAPPVHAAVRTKPALTVPLNGANYGKPYPPAGGVSALPPPNPPRATGRATVADDPPEEEWPPTQQSFPMAAPSQAHPDPVFPPSTTTSPGPIPVPGDVMPHNHDQHALLQSFQEMQRQLAETQSTYQRTMADTHLAYLRAAEASVTGLTALITGSEPHSSAIPGNGLAPPPLDLVPDPPVPLHAASPPPVVPPVERPADPIPSTEAREELVALPSGRVEMHPAEGASAVPVSAAANIDLQSLLLSTVAEKTGYPVEMLDLDMELEAGLGIDSIKRVEILSALREQAPDLPEVQPTMLSTFQTLQQIVTFMERSELDSDGGVNPVHPHTLEEDRSGLPTHEESGVLEDVSGSPPERALVRSVVREIHAPAAGFAIPGLLGANGPIVVTDDGQGIAPLLAARLQVYGVNAVSADRITEYTAGLILLAGLRDVPDESSSVAVNLEAFAAIQAAAPGLSAAGGVFVSVQDTGGDFGLSGKDPSRAWLAGLGALAKTAALEWPDAAVRAIDLERAGRSPHDLAEVLANELIFGGLEPEVGLHADGSRTVLCTVEEEPHERGELIVDHNSVLLASGGGRGVTAASLIALARAARPRIALLGRTRLGEEPSECVGVVDDAELKRVLLLRARADGRSIAPLELARQAQAIQASREVRATLQALTEAGSEAQYQSLDIRDSDAVAHAVTSVRRAWGPITGVVHGAGVRADKLIAEKTAEQLEQVFDTKVRGLQALLAATAEDPLTVICLFSSVAARTGNAGQSDYAMANEVLNKVARAEARRRGDACLVRALGWGPWDGGMVDPALKSHFEQQSVPLIPLELGAAQFVDELRSRGRDQVELVVTAGPPGLPEPQEWAADVLVHRAVYPYLDSHRVHGVPVVPVVLVLEWFMRAARALRPQWNAPSFRDLKVVRGIRLHELERTGNCFVLRVRHEPDGQGLALALRGPDETLHYTATAQAGDKLNSHQMTAPDDLELASWSWTIPEIYQNQLFHGPDFQMIRSLDGVSDRGAAAVLAGTREMGWNGVPWRTDAVALDGGLQLARLWTLHSHGYATLPTRIGSVDVRRTDLPEGPIRCVVRARAVLDHHTVSDIVFTSAGGTLIAELGGVEMHMVPSEAQSAP